MEFKIKANHRPAGELGRPPSLVQSPQFKDWFGQSKVLDQNGNPLMLWHSTNAPFTIFNRTEDAHLGYHFGTEEQALKIKGKRMLSVYLSIANPLKTIDAGDWSNPYRAWEVLNKALKGKLDSLMHMTLMQTPRQERLGVLTVALQELGYDGIVYRNRIEGRGDSWVALDSRQVKSADLNNGEFDATNPDITK